jgi:hypothetical protein
LNQAVQVFGTVKRILFEGQKCCLGVYLTARLEERETVIPYVLRADMEIPMRITDWKAATSNGIFEDDISDFRWQS